jgi:hypothetical protein
MRIVVANVRSGAECAEFGSTVGRLRSTNVRITVVKVPVRSVRGLAVVVEVLVPFVVAQAVSDSVTVTSKHWRMRFGLTLPIFDSMGDPHVLAELAHTAEQAGWEAVFVWDHVYYRPPVHAATDPWIAMAAIAMRTNSVRIGPMVTPLARRRPHVVARQVVALDHLSHGRFVLGVGLGLDGSGGEFQRFGEETDDKRRAAIFDEGLELLVDLLGGAPVDHDGEHFRASDVSFLPKPVREHIPVWVAARWPHRRPLRRAARHDGVFVIDIEPEQLPTVVNEIAAQRAAGLDGYDVVVDALPGTDPRPWADAGATWMLTTFDPFSASPELVREVIGAGPGATG